MLAAEQTPIDPSTVGGAALDIAALVVLVVIIAAVIVHWRRARAERRLY